jgi:DNA-binding MarR family transcriptional regulator
VSSDYPPPPPLIGALLRVPAQAIHRQLIDGLNDAGFEELRLPHIAVFQFPGPDGATPGALAERAGMSKQAMNQLLKGLEAAGYIERGGGHDDKRRRVVRLTKRGKAAYARIVDVLKDLERQWTSELGTRQFSGLKAMLTRVWQSPLAWPDLATQSDPPRARRPVRIAR